jgi:SnoaL-like protein
MPRREEMPPTLGVRGAVLIAALCHPTPIQAQAPLAGAAHWTADSTAIHGALNRFLQAFENLEWTEFRAAFADSASVFHPAWPLAERVAGPAGIDSTFQRVFAEIRAEATGGPPFHRLAVTDLSIRSLGRDVALVTFHLRSARRFGRRSVIFHRERIGWTIIHLHASNFLQQP